jgi:hypothetical protein
MCTSLWVTHCGTRGRKLQNVCDPLARAQCKVMNELEGEVDHRHPEMCTSQASFHPMRYNGEPSSLSRPFHYAACGLLELRDIHISYNGVVAGSVDRRKAGRSQGKLATGKGLFLRIYPSMRNFEQVRSGRNRCFKSDH